MGKISTLFPNWMIETKYIYLFIFFFFEKEREKKKTLSDSNNYVYKESGREKEESN